MAKICDVIIIEDDPNVSSVVAMYCENMGCFRNIITAADGAIASSKLANQKFGIILLDINMPKKTGTNILADFEKSGLNSLDSIIIISGELNKNVMTKAISVGVKNFLVKPFDEEAFKEKVTQVVNKIFGKKILAA